MKSFHDQFSPDPDPDMAEYRRVWLTRKTLFNDAVVAYAPPFPNYATWKAEEWCGDPSSPSARECHDTVEVAMYHNKNGFGGYQERAWDYLGDNLAKIEDALRRKLFALHRKNLQDFLDDLPNREETQDYWGRIKDQIEWSERSAINHLYKLVRIGLVDDGLDDCGFTSFDFQTGWDLDHGASVLMHKGNTLIAGGMQEFTTFFAESLVPTIKSAQAYGLDDGDLSLI